MRKYTNYICASMKENFKIVNKKPKQILLKKLVNHKKYTRESFHFYSSQIE